MIMSGDERRMASSDMPASDATPRAELAIPHAILAEVYRHASEGRSEEVCGLLIGPRGESLQSINEVRRCENHQNALHALDPAQFPRTAATAYSLGSKDLFFVERSQRSERPVRVIYHSHVDKGAYFSDEDQRGAVLDGQPSRPEIDYLVIDAGPAGVRGAKLFRFDPDAGRFVEVAAYPGFAEISRGG